MLYDTQQAASKCGGATYVPYDFLLNAAIMSAPFMSLQRCCQRSALLIVARRQWSSSSVSPPPLHTRLLLFLTQRFYDVEMLLSWGSRLGRRGIQKKNVYYGYTQKLYGSDIAAAYYILSLKGGFRYVGQPEWFLANQRGKFNWDFLKHKDTPLEEVNMSYTVINYTGLGNLGNELQLSLVLFQGLRRLDVSSLPGISSPGLVVILLEEMLPQCQITATGYDHNLRQERVERTEKHMEGQSVRPYGAIGRQQWGRGCRRHRDVVLILKRNVIVWFFSVFLPVDFLRNLFSSTLGLGSADKVLDELTLDAVARYIKSGKCKNIICMVGAGISTSAGIPDFRSPGTGLYANLQKYDLPYPEAIFQIDYFEKHPEPFFALAKELYPGQFKPTICHYFMKLLKDKGHLKRCYTQNIDTLERVAGLEGEDLIEAHGTFYTSHCVSFCCRREYNLDWMKDKIFSDDIPRCDKCNSLVKPDIVFFGENLPVRFFTSVKMDFPCCDLLIVMGTSLQVQPFAGLVGRVSKSCPRLLINMEKAGQADPLFGLMGFGGGMDFDSDKAYRDVAHISTCDEGCLALAELLGWKEELEELVKQEHARIDSQDKKQKASGSKGAAAKASSASVAPEPEKEE
ncbi:hypothetical protein FQN60_004607 [Etheostoma spectabile]|uniref:NAD-dependent protein deacetylase sirtuin-2 n=1 Tax=Etheostoma spectabile TaxID=54343 RepID=A0A5J5DKF4_9PERO|nr:hypothetical protein FQN60_004607 [Etheostoma spectabile]